MQDDYFVIDITATQKAFGFLGEWNGTRQYSKDELINADKVNDILKMLWKIMNCGFGFNITFENYSYKKYETNATFMRVCNGCDGKYDLYTWDENYRGYAVNNWQEEIDRKKLRKILNDVIVRWNDFVNSQE